MGQFSWIYSDTGKQLLDDVKADAYLLVPKLFQKEYGKSIHETFYDGYGNFGEYDVYDLLALWNRDYLPMETKVLSKPKIENYGGLYSFEKDELRKNGMTEEEIEKMDMEERQCHYNRAVKRYERSLQRIKDFMNRIPDLEMKEKYGRSYLREIGIDIGCYDEDNAKLKYPIKITTKEMEYEEVAQSKSDPNQGWGEEDDENEE